MKVIPVLALVLASAAGLHLALGASNTDRPRGIDAQHWIVVSDKMGFVVTSDAPYPTAGAKQDLLLTPPTEGYFMVRAAGGWQRIIINNPIKGPGTAG